MGAKLHARMRTCIAIKKEMIDDMKGGSRFSLLAYLFEGRRLLALNDYASSAPDL